jgi:outer membrane protein TolC
LTAQSETAAAAACASQTRAALAPLQEGLELARRTLAVARQTYELGRMTALMYSHEQRRYWEMERAYTDVVRQAYEAQAFAAERAWRTAMSEQSGVTLKWPL